MTYNPYSTPESGLPRQGHHCCKRRPSPWLALASNRPRPCPDCGQPVRIPQHLYRLGVLSALACAAVAAAFSIKHRSWLPYAPGIGLIVLSQWWLGWRAPRVIAVPRPAWHSAANYVLLAIFLCALTYFSR